MHTILFVEDDESTINIVKLILKNENFNIIDCFLISRAIEKLKLGGIDLVILDLMLPDGDGLEVLKMINEEKINVPVLILSGIANIDKKLIGLENGAEDYLTKPFDRRELLARINVLLRRNNQANSSNHLGYNGLTIDDAMQCAYYDNVKIKFTRSEYSILRNLIISRGKVMSKKDLLDGIYGDEEKRPNDKIIDVYIFNVRSKLAKATNGKIILQSEWGSGIKLL